MKIDTPFRLEFLTIETNNFKDKKKAILQELKKYPEKKYSNFSSNRSEIGLADAVANIFQEEFLHISEHYKGNIASHKAFLKAGYKEWKEEGNLVWKIKEL